ncbi:MAG: DUF5615 family PIN-like protein [Anaerolineae bacterium]
MRIPANENFPADVVIALREAGHDVAWIRSDAPGSSDWEVLRQKQAEGRVRFVSLKERGLGFK